MAPTLNPRALIVPRSQAEPCCLPLPCRVQLLGKRQVLQEALQALQVALCGQAKLQAQQELLQAKVEQLGPGEPPPVPLLQEDRHSTSSSVSKCHPPACALSHPAQYLCVHPCPAHHLPSMPQSYILSLSAVHCPDTAPAHCLLSVLCLPASPGVLLIFALPLPKPGHLLMSVPGLRSLSGKGAGRPLWSS